MSEIAFQDNGPILVSGTDIVLKDSAGRTFDLSGRQSVALCRCGQSANKPFCDGSHKKIAFSSKIEARTLAPPKPKI
jgi:CDGSH-type Zn-finger protein